MNKICLYLLVFLAFPRLASASEKWVLESDGISLYPDQFVYVVSTRHAQNPSMSSGTEGTYIAWTELNFNGISQVYVKKRSPEGWVQVGQSLNVNEESKAFLPSVAMSQGDPYVSWIETDSNGINQGYVRKWNGEKWDLVGSSLNNDARADVSAISVAIHESAPYAAWVEDVNNTGLLQVKKWNGSRWVQIGAALNQENESYPADPVIKIDSGHIFVAWSEVSPSGIFKSYVAQNSGNVWQVLGKILNSSPERHAFSPSIGFGKNGIVAALTEIGEKNVMEIFVKQFDGSKWETVGTLPLNIDGVMHASSPNLAVFNDKYYVAFTEKNRKNRSSVYVKSFSDGRWQDVEDSLNMTKDMVAGSPHLIAANDGLFVAWRENTDIGVFRIFVKKLDGMVTQ